MPYLCKKHDHVPKSPNNYKSWIEIYISRPMKKEKSRFCSQKRVEHAHDEGKLMMINIINIEYIIPIFLSSSHDVLTMNQLKALDNING